MKMFRFLLPGLLSGIAALLLSFPLLASTGREHEITEIHFENVTQTTVDVVWTTAHPSTSQVLIARSTDYEPERWAPETADKTLVTSHRVTVDQLVPYNPRNGDGTYYIYVASVDGKGEMSTAPGPATPDGKNPFITMRTRPTDTMGEPKWTFYPMGPNEVFAGHDMYFLIQGILIAGPADDLYVMNQVSPNGEADGIVKSLDAGAGNPDTIGVHFSCNWSNPSGADANDQTIDRSRNLGYCQGQNNNIRNLTFRLRTKPNTAPGKYSVTFTLETGAKKQTGTYEFTVLPPATAPAHPRQQVAKSIPGLGTWEKQMVELGNKWCQYRDQQNIAGNFVDNWGWTGDAWFYDGGRSYENIDTYTAAAGHPNHAYWQHCAINLLDPYANWQVANDANMQGFSTFTYGMAMNYQRTHAEVMRKAISMLATVGPQHVSVGMVDPWGMREMAYRSNAWMTDEMLGAPRYPLLQRNIDKLMGTINMIGRGQGGGAVHPFMVGLAMETLIHWYELNLAEGHPDYRVVPVIKEGLDGLWTYNWLPKQHMFDYNRYRLPPNLGSDYSALNNLVSVAYAWYWLQTDDTEQRDRGDQLFEHAFDNPAASSWSGKQFSQQFEFSFDYVRFRKGIDGSTVLPENNPYTGPYADTVPPISEKVNCDPNYGYLKGCKAGTIGSTTAQIFWTTYKPSTTQLIYGKSTNYGQASPLDKNMVLDHVVNLTGLQPGTTYHFRTKSVDRAGNVGSMHDLTFTTTAQ
jgi:hypothetical protein